MTSELFVRTSGQLEKGCVRGGQRAGLGVVVDCPLVLTDQQRGSRGVRGCKKTWIFLVFCFPQTVRLVVPYFDIFFKSTLALPPYVSVETPTQFKLITFIESHI